MSRERTSSQVNPTLSQELVKMGKSRLKDSPKNSKMLFNMKNRSDYW